MFGFNPPASAEAQAAINDEILIVAMIESPEAVENCDRIAAVDGIDALLIGTSDLTAEMGIAGQMAHRRIAEAYGNVGEACRRNGKFLGMGGVYDEENARRYLGMGVQFILAGGDHLYLMTGGSARTSFLRGPSGQMR